MKIQKTKKFGGGGLGGRGRVGVVRVDVIEELKFLGKFKKKKLGGGGGQGVCEGKIEVFVKIQKTKKFGGGSGWM